MNIKSYNKTYSVNFVDKIDLYTLTNKMKHLIVSDTKVFSLYKNTIFNDVDAEDVFLIEASEANKTINTALELCKRMAEVSFKRNDVLVSIGGGIIQDITGFAANIYNRGVKWTYIPTTLLSQCDSCIGGKTSLNYLNYKNILGTFYAPDKIYIDLNLVLSLSDDDYRSGLGEVVKFNIIAGSDGIELIEKNIDKLLDRDLPTLRFFLERSLDFKKRFIEEDEFDNGLRRQLNFAHTFGHAFETVSQYAIPHGQAVTLGVLIANSISLDRSIMDSYLHDRIYKICRRLISVEIDSAWFNPDNIIEAMKKDKKRVSPRLTAVLLNKSNELEIIEDLEVHEVVNALSKIYHNFISKS